MCVFILAYTGSFQIEEVLHIKYGDISFHRDHVPINVYRSKTDQLGKGSQVVIPERSATATCPVAIFRRYLSLLG